MRDAPRNIPQELPMNTMELIDDIAIHHEVALTLVQLVELIGGGIGYERHREVVMNVIGTEVRGAAAASMKALTEKIDGYLEQEDRP